MFVNALDNKVKGLHLYTLMEEDQMGTRLERWLEPEHAANDNLESRQHDDPFWWQHHDEGCWCDEPSIIQELEIEPTMALDM